jgi:hypothetical protein
MIAFPRLTLTRSNFLEGAAEMHSAGAATHLIGPRDRRVERPVNFEDTRAIPIARECGTEASGNRCPAI